MAAKKNGMLEVSEHSNNSNILKPVNIAQPVYHQKNYAPCQSNETCYCEDLDTKDTSPLAKCKDETKPLVLPYQVSSKRCEQKTNSLIVFNDLLKRCIDNIGREGNHEQLEDLGSTESEYDARMSLSLNSSSPKASRELLRLSTAARNSDANDVSLELTLNT